MSIGSRARRIVEALWSSDSVIARALRVVLRPIEAVFAAGVARRNRGFDGSPKPRQLLASLSVGNLTVGGTGKTPIGAWCVQQLRARGANPAVVLRGYGDDEWRVHGVLNPGCTVVVGADRAAGLISARMKHADCAVLDDAFQHRQVHRVADIVLVSADQWNGRVRLLPAGPFREPLAALHRAQVIVITAKAASRDVVSETMQAVIRVAPEVPVAIVRLQPDMLRLAVTLPVQSAVRIASGESAGASAPRAVRVPESLTHRADWLRGRTIAVATAIGDPAAFVAQLKTIGASVSGVFAFADHHAYSSADAARIVAGARGAECVVCTLKDAVKLAQLWPREAPPLWYVSQTVVVERGAEALDRVFARVLAARAGTAPTAG